MVRQEHFSTKLVQKHKEHFPELLQQRFGSAGIIVVHFISLICDKSQLKISDFSGERFKDFEVLFFSTCSTTTQLFSSG
jgi:hypothetical protein